MTQQVVPDTTMAELNHLVEAAHEAYLIARTVPPTERKAWLYAITMRRKLALSSHSSRNAAVGTQRAPPGSWTTARL